MKITRRTLAVAGAALTVTLLAACGSSGGVGGGTAEQNTGKSATINYWTWFPPQATLDTAIAAFEKQNPKIKVKLRTFENADYQKQLPLALSGGENIDVVGVQVSAMTNSVKDYLKPVSTWADDWLNTINPTMLEQTKDIASDGKLYSVPLGSIGSPIMYYNAELLGSLGLKVPTTAAEWKTDVDAIKAAHPEMTTPVVFQGDPYWQEEMLFGIAEQKSPGLSDDIIGGDGSWDQAGIVDGLKAYKSLFDNGTISTDVLSLKGSRPSELFTAGQAAFYIDGSWQNSLLSSEYRKANDIKLADVGAVAIPVVNGGKVAVRALAEGGLGIPKSSKNVAAASKFIQFMLSAKGADVWAKDLILVPSLKGYEVSSSVLTSKAAKDGFARASEAIANPTSQRNSQQDFLNQVEGNTILDVLRGTTSAENAAKHLQDEWTSGRYPHSAGK